MSEKPIKNSYWVIPGKLLAGEYPRNKDEESSRAKIDALLSVGIHTFIDLTEETEGLVPYASLLRDRAIHKRFAIKDVSVPPSKNLTGEILDTIDQQLAQGRKVYIHCWGGVGRTGVIVGCWLARHGVRGTPALEKLRELWRACPKSVLRSSPETSEQERYILDWNEALENKNQKIGTGNVMNWFEGLTGFKEESPDQVRSNLVLDGERLASKINGRTMICGRLETPSLAELRERVSALGNRSGGKLTINEAIGDVKDFHLDAANAGALFQVASQFNLLEMVSPSKIPEDGVGIYEYDPTQGPACAIAAGAGTIYRNYFVPVNNQIGQTVNNQIDCLADVGRSLGNTNNRLWKMRNGYALASRDGLLEISERLQAMDMAERDRLRERLRIGIQWNTQVTPNGCTHLVSQAYCSALPVTYSDVQSDLWEDFARLVLEASYEAAICAGILNARETGNNRIYLTMLGGGAFGNAPNWINDSIRQVFRRYENQDIEAVFISRNRSSTQVRDIIQGI